MCPQARIPSFVQQSQSFSGDGRRGVGDGRGGLEGGEGRRGLVEGSPWEGRRGRREEVAEVQLETLSLYQLETHAICISRNASQERRMVRGDPGEERRGRTREVSAPLPTSSSQLPPHQGQTRLEG